jgi:outer membrane usher protein FimD/PapC
MIYTHISHLKRIIITIICGIFCYTPVYADTLPTDSARIQEIFDRIKEEFGVGQFEDFSMPQPSKNNTKPVEDTDRNTSYTELLHELTRIRNRLERVEQKLEAERIRSIDEVSGVQDSIHDDTLFVQSQNPDTTILDDIQTVEPDLQRTDNTTLDEEELTREEMYRRAFGTAPPPIPDTCQCELIIDGVSHGLITYYTQDKKIGTEKLLPILENILIKDSLMLLDSIIVDNQIAEYDLHEQNITLNAEFEGQICYMQFPFSWYKQGMAYSSPQSSSGHYQPSNFSGYLNARGRQRYRMMDSKNPCDTNCQDDLILGNNNERRPLSVNFDAAMNIFSFVAEGNATYYEGENEHNPFEITAARIVRDIVSKRIRITAGDVNTSSGLFGIGARKQRAISPLRNSIKLNEVEFELRNASQIRIFVNGRFKEMKNLEPGVYQITDFENITEESVVELEVTDFAGAKDFLRFNFLEKNASSLLSRGETEWNISLGVDRSQRFSDFQFSPDSLVLHGNYTRGIFPWLQSTLEGRLSSYGYNSGALGCTMFSPRGIHYSTTMGIQQNRINSGYYLDGSIYGDFKRDRTNESVVRWRFRTKYSDNYSANRQSTSSSLPDQFVQFSGGVSASLPKSTSIGLQIGHYMNNDHAGSFLHQINNNTKVSTIFNKSWENGFTAGLTASYNKFDIQGSELLIKLSARYRFRAGNHYFRISNRLRQTPVTPLQDSSTGGISNGDENLVKEWNNTGMFNWNYNQYGRTGMSYSMSSDATLTRDYNYVGSQISASSNFGVLDVGYMLADQQNEYIDAIQREASIGFATGVAWSGKSVSITRPVNGSFAIVRNNKNMRFRKTRVNPMGNTEEAIVYPFLPSVITNIGNYQNRKLHLDPDLPFGSEPIQQEYHLAPRYKSGFEIVVGSMNGVVALGTLLQETGAPFARHLITVFPLNSDGTINRNKIQTSFTNANGRFQFSGIPGRTYIIEVRSDVSIFAGRVTVSEDADRVYDCNEIILQEK